MEFKFPEGCSHREKTRANLIDFAKKVGSSPYVACPIPDQRDCAKKEECSAASKEWKEGMGFTTTKKVLF